MSEERILGLAREMLRALEKSGAVVVDPALRGIAETRLAKVMLEDLSAEEVIEREARRRLRAMPSAPPEDSSEWQVMLRREKEILANRKGLVL